MTRTSLLATTSLALLSFITACDDEPATPAPSEVRARLSTDLKNVLDQSVAANDGTIMSLAPPAFLGQFIDLGGGSTDSESAFAPDDEPTEESDEIDPQEIIDQLNAELFTDANEVSPGIYAVPATFECGEPDGTDEYVECANNWSQLALRVRVSENGSELTFSVQIGAQHDEPLAVALTHESISLSVDLDEAEGAMESVAAALGEEAPHANLTGAFTGSLTVLGAAHVALDLTVDRDVMIAVAEQGVDLAGPDAFLVSTPASHLIHLDLDGNAETGSVAVDLKSLIARIPDDGETTELQLPTIKFAASLSNAMLAVSQLSFSQQVFLKRNGQTAVAIDVNPDNRNDFEATLTDDGAGGARFEVSPALDVRIDLDHAVLGDELPVYDISRVLLTGALRGSEGSDAIQVENGTFSIETNPTGHGFNATAGQCVTGEDIYDDVTFTSYTQFTVGACN